MYKKMVIGIDESYTRSGISIAVDGNIRKMSSVNYKGCKNKAEKRIMLSEVLSKVIESNSHKAMEMVVICERIRTFSQGNKKDKGFISTNYIKATGALIATIVDTSYKYGVDVYSVDTRSWKSQVIGTSKSRLPYEIEVPKEKANKVPTLEFMIKLGFESSIMSINKKGRKVYNDDAADSGGIALYGFIPKSRQKLKKEE